MMTSVSYPASPSIDRTKITQTSAAYHTQAIRVLFSIVLFIVTYLLVLGAAVAFFVACLYIIAAIATYIRGMLLLLIAIGLLFMGAMLCFFLIKFLFQVKKANEEGKIVLIEEQHPALFSFITKLCEETKTKMPKKVVLSTAVNASVYYDSSFLSLFLPVRKNLEIGAGLVNSINLTEFKAVLAHELGHFSQSSTRLGSYIYRFNVVIHNLLYENEGWLTALESFMSLSGVFSFFGNITVWIVKGVVRLFQGIYKIMNLGYLALSREMEFHADSVAVSVTGSKAIIHALYRLEFGQAAHQNTIQQLMAIDENNTIIPTNFFELQKINLHKLAEENQLQLVHGLPRIEKEKLIEETVKGRLEYKDVWASHPTIEEREKQTHQTFIDGPEDHNSPWLLFADPKKLQEELSKQIDELEKPNKETEVIESAILAERIKHLESAKAVNSVYGEYYQFSSNEASPPKSITDKIKDLKATDLFGNAAILKLKKYLRDLQDTETMRLISCGHLPVKKFVFDGQVTTRYYSKEIFETMKSDVEKSLEEIKEHNFNISTWFFVRAVRTNVVLATDYKTLLEFNKQFLDDLEGISGFLQILEKFYEEHILVYRDVEDIPYQSKKIREIYSEMQAWRLALPERNIPNTLNGIFNKSYRKLFTEKEISDPSSLENLEGLVPFHEDLKALVSELSGYGTKLQKPVLELQDEILVSA